MPSVAYTLYLIYTLTRKKISDEDELFISIIFASLASGATYFFMAGFFDLKFLYLFSPILTVYVIGKCKKYKKFIGVWFSITFLFYMVLLSFAVDNSLHYQTFKVQSSIIDVINFSILVNEPQHSLFLSDVPIAGQLVYGFVQARHKPRGFYIYSIDQRILPLYNGEISQVVLNYGGYKYKNFYLVIGEVSLPICASNWRVMPPLSEVMLVITHHFNKVYQGSYINVFLLIQEW